MPSDTDSTIRKIEFELEKAEHGMALGCRPEVGCVEAAGKVCGSMDEVVELLSEWRN